MNKALLLDAIIHHLASELETLYRIAEESRSAAIEDDLAQEGKYDTRAIESKYLAGGQRARAAQLEAEIQQLKTLSLSSSDCVGIGSLVELEEKGKAGSVLYYMLPTGGFSFTFEGQAFQILSHQSPLGVALLQLSVGEGAEIETPAGEREFSILSIW